MTDLQLFSLFNILISYSHILDSIKYQAITQTETELKVVVNLQATTRPDTGPASSLSNSTHILVEFL